MALNRFQGTPPQPPSPDYKSDPRWRGSRAEQRLAWLQVQLPLADFSKWTEEEIKAFDKLVSHHCCAVCGRWDDEGCYAGC